MNEGVLRNFGYIFGNKELKRIVTIICILETSHKLNTLFQSGEYGKFSSERVFAEE